MVDLIEKVENEYYRLKGRLVAGYITHGQFEAELKKLIIEDSQGRSWMLGVDSAKWYVYDGQAWIEAEPRSGLNQRDGIPRKSILFIIGATSILLVLCLGGLIAIFFGANESLTRVSVGHTPTQTIVTIAIRPLTSTSTAIPIETRLPIPRDSPASMPTPTSIMRQTQTPLPTSRIPAATPSRTRTLAPPNPTVAHASFGCPDTQGRSLFYDDFSNLQSGWTPYRSTDYEHFYENGEFHFSVLRKNFTGNTWILLRDLGTNYRIEVQARRSSGPEMNNYGLIFGGQNDVTYNSFLISDAGSYRVVKQVEGQRNGLVAWTQTPRVNETGPNYLGLRIENTLISFCLNGQVLTTMSDPTLKSGRVGLIAGAFDEPVQIHFDNFGVWKID